MYKPLSKFHHKAYLIGKTLYLETILWMSLFDNLHIIHKTILSLIMNFYSIRNEAGNVL